LDSGKFVAKPIVFFTLLGFIAFSLFSNEAFAQQSPEDCGPNQVFQLGFCQDIEESGPQAFVVETDQPSYEDGDTIIISGNVGTVSESYPDTPVSIIVIGPDGKTAGIIQTTPSSNGSFSHTLIAGGSMQISGVYEVTATYGTQKSTTTFSFESSSSTTPTIDVEGFTVGYQITGGSILSIASDVEFRSLIIKISTNNDGELTITLPRALLDSVLDNGDDDVFFVLVDGHEVFFDETKTSTDRTLTIDFSYRASEIEIIGTFVVGSGGGTILDTVPPKILQPKDIVVDASDSNGAIVTYEVLAIDNEDEIIKPSCSPSSGSLFPIGVTTVVCSAFDSSGNAATQKSFLVTVNMPSLLIPDWIKEIAAFWCDDKIDDAAFIEGIQYLIDNGIIIVDATTSGSGGTQEIPSWVKNNACWWSQGLISDVDFASGLKYLIEIGVIKI